MEELQKLQTANEEAEAKKEEEDTADESFLETPLGGLTMVAGLAAIGAGAYLLFKKK